VVVVLLASVGWVGYRAMQVRDHLNSALTLVATLQQQILDGDTDAALTTVADIKDQTGAAGSAANDALWSVAQHAPFLGDDLATVRLLADSSDQLAWRVLTPLATAASGLDPAKLAPHDGTIDLDGLLRARAEIAHAADGITEIQHRLADIHTGNLIGPVADAVTKFRNKLSEAQGVTDAALRAADLLPPMLGQDGPRTYLVVFQNPDELRATGGIFGAYTVISVDHGHIELVKQGATSTDIQKFDPPVVTLPANQRELYSVKAAQWPVDVNLIPDFPQAAQLFATMYEQRFGTRADGVIATDPVALSYILRATGPMALPTMVQQATGVDQLTADNAVPFLLKEAYAAGSPQLADAIFAATANTVFHALISGHGSSARLLTALGKATGEHRILVWSAHQQEQQKLAQTSLAGALASHDGANPTVGVFLNDGTGGKLDYYLHQQVAVRASDCLPGGKLALTVSVTLTSKAPTSGLPAYVTGLAMAGPYSVRTQLLFYTPSGGSTTAMTQDAVPVKFGDFSDFGRGVAKVTVDLAPGDSTTLEATMVTGPLESHPTGIDVRTTPMAWPTTITVGKLPACTRG
jgi:hypothetical protein